MKTITVGRDQISVDVPAGVTLPDLSGRDWMDDADETHQQPNGVESVYEYGLDGGLALYIHTDQGCPVSADIRPAGDIAAYLADCERGDLDAAEWLASWGHNGLSALTEADADRTEPCRVWCEPQYYAGTCGAPAPGYVRDEAGEIREWPTAADAQDYVDEYYNAPSGYDGIRACNVLSHGQAAADELTIVEA